MKSGNLDHLVKLQQEVRVPKSSGGAEYDWFTLDPEVWVAIKTLQGNSLFLAKQLEPNITVQLTLRFRTDVKLGMRFLEETPIGKFAYLLKQPPRDPLKNYVSLECLCQEVEVHD